MNLGTGGVRSPAHVLRVHQCVSVLATSPPGTGQSGIPPRRRPCERTAGSCPSGTSLPTVSRSPRAWGLCAAHCGGPSRPVLTREELTRRRGKQLPACQVFTRALSAHPHEKVRPLSSFTKEDSEVREAPAARSSEISTTTPQPHSGFCARVCCRRRLSVRLPMRRFLLRRILETPRDSTLNPSVCVPGDVRRPGPHSGQQFPNLSRPHLNFHNCPRNELMNFQEEPANTNEPFRTLTSESSLTSCFRVEEM